MDFELISTNFLLHSNFHSSGKIAVNDLVDTRNDLQAENVFVVIFRLDLIWKRMFLTIQICLGVVNSF